MLRRTYKGLVANGGWGDRIGSLTLHTGRACGPVSRSRIRRREVLIAAVQPVGEPNAGDRQVMPDCRRRARHQGGETLAFGFEQQVLTVLRNLNGGIDDHAVLILRLPCSPATAYS